MVDWKLVEPKQILDPNSKKPDDWVDDEYMDDTTAMKPLDWEDESRIPDESAQRPEDWDEAEDGEWEPPLKDNPKYKGEWKPKKINFHTNIQRLVTLVLIYGK